MVALIQERHIVEDHWQTLDAEAALPESGDIIIPLCTYYIPADWVSSLVMALALSRLPVTCV